MIQILCKAFLAEHTQPRSSQLHRSQTALYVMKPAPGMPYCLVSAFYSSWARGFVLYGTAPRQFSDLVTVEDPAPVHVQSPKKINAQPMFSYVIDQCWWEWYSMGSDDAFYLSLHLIIIITGFIDFTIFLSWQESSLAHPYLILRNEDPLPPRISNIWLTR